MEGVAASALEPAEMWEEMKETKGPELRDATRKEQGHRYSGLLAFYCNTI